MLNNICYLVFENKMKIYHLNTIEEQRRRPIIIGPIASTTPLSQLLFADKILRQ